jgi:hypothetical protein
VGVTVGVAVGTVGGSGSTVGRGGVTVGVGVPGSTIGGSGGGGTSGLSVRVGVGVGVGVPGSITGGRSGCTGGSLCAEASPVAQITAMTIITAIIALKDILLIRFTFLDCLPVLRLFSREPCACDHDPVCAGLVQTGEWCFAVFRVYPMRVSLVNRSQKGRAACRRCRVKMSTVSMIPCRGRIEERVYIDTFGGRFCGIPDAGTKGGERFCSAGVPCIASQVRGHPGYAGIPHGAFRSVGRAVNAAHLGRQFF